MAIKRFPPVDLADESGLLALGGDLELPSLELSYRSGIFPWPLYGELAWFAPPQRTLLFLDEFHVSKSLQRKMKRSEYEFKIDCRFKEVITTCASTQNRKDGTGTWITPQMIDAYTRFNRAGFAHSIECYRAGSLVGGLYGVAINGMFAGESMFYKERDASKMCLCFLVDHLRKRGGKWIDCQQKTKLLLQFGAQEMPRECFMKLLEDALQSEVKLF